MPSCPTCNCNLDEEIDLGQAIAQLSLRQAVAMLDEKVDFAIKQAIVYSPRLGLPGQGMYLVDLALRIRPVAKAFIRAAKDAIGDAPDDIDNPDDDGSEIEEPNAE